MPRRSSGDHQAPIGAPSRRGLLAGGGSLLLLAPRIALGQGAAVGAAVESSLAKSLATSIGSSLAKGAVGAVGAYALGQILSVAGFDMSGQAAMMGKLNEIIDRLKVLQQSVDQLRATLLKTLSKLSYDVAVGQVQPLIDLNGTLTDSYAALLRAAPGEVDGARADILALTDATLLKGPRTWHNALVGGSGQTGLIEAWGRDVFNAHAKWYAADAARAMQTQWNYLDAQQAMTVNFLVEHLNATHQRAKAIETLRQWHRNRGEQAAKLRGMVDAVLPYATIGADGQIVTGGFGVRHLPPYVAISVPTNIMWCLVVGAPVAQGADEAAFQREIAGDIAAVTTNTGVGAPETFGQATENFWQILGNDEIIAMMKECGGDVGGGADHFEMAMRARGFVFPEDHVRIWTNDARDFAMFGPPLRIRTAMVENESWWHYNPDPTARAMVLLGRRLAPGEADNYWYANA